MTDRINKNVSQVIVLILSFCFLINGYASGAQVTDDVEHKYRHMGSPKVDIAFHGMSGKVDVRINLQRDIDMDNMIWQLEAMGVKIFKKNTVSVNYLEATMDVGILDIVSNLQQVSRVQPIFEPQVLMNYIQHNSFMGMDTPQSFGFNGSGVLAEVVDSGCDFDHNDLGSIQYTDFTVFEDSHGTCTSGIMFGDGTGNADAQGIIYGATGVFADWGNGNALGISNLWDGDFYSGNAGQNGVVQTNSWWNGAELDSEYDSLSNEIDQAIVDHPKVLTHWAIGNSNDGTSEGLMSAESISKNNMAVGAIFHYDTIDPSDDDWHDDGAGATPSRGPTADGRVKPDLCAAFDEILCTDRVGLPGYVGDDYFYGFGGTSGACPTVAGCSGLTYEMYQENYFNNNPEGVWPYSCTVKALMIADAAQYEMTGPNQITRNVQGWGRPDMENMYDLGPDYHVIEEYPQALDGGESWDRRIYSHGAHPLKITLAWVDPAAPGTTLSDRALVNNLDLHVISPSGVHYWGNNGLGSALYSSSGTGNQRWSNPTMTGYRDDLNNVENVFIENPEIGVWTVEIQGRTGDVAEGPQDFSLVASGTSRISSIGEIVLDQPAYLIEDIATITVFDLDLDTSSSTIQTVNVNINSTTELTGETVMLTETDVDTATFQGTIPFSTTNGVGVLQVSPNDIITALYIDADDGTGSPNTPTDISIIDNDPPGPPSNLTVQWSGSGIKTLYKEDFEGDGTPTFIELGWTTGGESNDWEIGTPNGLGGDHGNPDPSNASSGNFSIGNDLTGIGAYPGDYEAGILEDSNWIYSPAIDCSMATNIWLHFDRYLSVESFIYDEAYIEIATSTTGPWYEVWKHLNSIDDDEWNKTSYNITTWAEYQPTVYIRFEIGSTDGSYQHSGWNIDDIYVEGFVSVTDDNSLDWALSLDDGAGDDDVYCYNIYRSENEIGPWNETTYIDSVPAGTGSYIDDYKGEIDGIGWWYVVRAEDLPGNEEMNTNAAPEYPQSNIPPETPSLPLPSNAATNVDIDTILSVHVSDLNGDSLDVHFYDSSGPALIGTDFGVPSGTNATVTWNGRSELTTYNWYAVADDGEYTTQSPTWSFTTTDVTPPGSPSSLTVDWWGSTVTTVYNEDFEGDGTPTFTELGWTPGGSSNDWELATPSGLGGEHGNPDPTSGANGSSFCIGNDLTDLGSNPGDYEANLAVDSNYIYSPAIDCSLLSSTTLYFDRYLNVESPGYDQAHIEVSNDEIVWHNVWTNIVTTTDSAWSTKSYDISTWADHQSTVYIRFELGDSDNNYFYSGWNIDNVRVDGIVFGGSDDNTLNWTLSSDDGAGADDVEFYLVYRSLSAIGPWNSSTLMDTIPSGIDTYTDPGRGEFDGINWWYLVRAKDIYGNVDQNTNAVPEILPPNDPPNAPTDPIPVHTAEGIELAPTLSVNVSDPNGDPMNVLFYNASGPTLIGVDHNVPSGGRASIIWPGLKESTTYNWYAVADDGQATNQSLTWNFTTQVSGIPGCPLNLEVIAGASAMLTWDHNPISGHEFYYVFTSDDRFIFEFSTVPGEFAAKLPNTATTWTDSSGNLSGVTTRYYIVRSWSAIGWSENSTMVSWHRFTFNYNTGLKNNNYISLPYNWTAISAYPNPGTASDIVTAIEGGTGSGFNSDITLVGKWDSATQGTDNYYYSTFPVPGWVGTDFDINPGEGINIVLSETATNFEWITAGTDFNTTQYFTYNSGLKNNNYLGCAWSTNLATASDIVTDIEGGTGGGANTDITLLGKWNPATQGTDNYYYSAFPVPGWVGTDFVINPGDGINIVLSETATTFIWDTSVLTKPKPDTWTTNPYIEP